MSGESPNPLTVAWSIVGAMRKRRPDPSGDGTVDHAELGGVLDILRESGVAALPGQRVRLASYRRHLAGIDPDALSRNEALAFWMNLYNAGALDVAAQAAAQLETTVLRIPGAFSRPWIVISDEELSLDDIEHGKIRRFKDPRIHGALVCGSASCPTLRYEPYRGADIDQQLDSQMRAFLAGGAAVYEESSNRLLLSRVLLWYGADFVRPRRMPTWIPASKRNVATAVSEWLEPSLQVAARGASIAYQPYDWGLACSIG
jgi:hypothetical protein